MRKLTLFAIGLTCFSAQLKASTFTVRTIPCPPASSIQCGTPGQLYYTDKTETMKSWPCSANGWTGQMNTTLTVDPKNFKAFSAKLSPNPVCIYGYGSGSDTIKLTNAALNGMKCTQVDNNKPIFNCS